MRLYKSHNAAFLFQEGTWFLNHFIDWNLLLKRRNLYAYILSDIENWEKLDTQPDFEIFPPIGNQEVWAAGVTYLKSKIAREIESDSASVFYDLVYTSPRPELFFKSNAHRVVGHLGQVNIRKDSNWNVPEPELTLLCSQEGTIEGYTIGNDVSSRDIEGQNPLYLPQAKTYDHSASIGPCILISENPISIETEIRMQITRDDVQIYKDKVSIARMKRKHDELVSWLFRELSFPNGCFLMTGTCLVPEDGFSLRVGDQISIQIDGIGELINKVGVKTK